MAEDGFDEINPPPPSEAEIEWFLDVPEGAAEPAKVVDIKSKEPVDMDAATDALGFRITDWSTDRYTGEAPPIEWLCEGTVPRAVPVLLAAMGGVGKSFMGLDLGLEIAAAVVTGETRRIIGGNVVARGSVVILSAEDSKDSIHRRLEKIDLGNRREAALGRIFVVPLPDVGGPMPLITGANGEFEQTPKFKAFVAQLAQIEDLALVIVDPLQAFVLANITADPAAGQFMWSSFAQICAVTGATFIGFHHMRKDGAKNIETVQDAREAIRGVTTLVDGARIAYALWTAKEDEAERVCAQAGIEAARDKVVHGAVVKANDEHDAEVHTYIRGESGLLMDATEVGRQVKTRRAKLSSEDCHVAMLEIDLRWGQRRPFGKAPQAVDRYLVSWMVYRFNITKEVAKKQMEKWFAAGLIADVEFDKHRKLNGIKVEKWAG